MDTHIVFFYPVWSLLLVEHKLKVKKSDCGRDLCILRTIVGGHEGGDLGPVTNPPSKSKLCMCVSTSDQLIR